MSSFVVEICGQNGPPFLEREGIVIIAQTEAGEILLETFLSERRVQLDFIYCEKRMGKTLYEIVREELYKRTVLFESLELLGDISTEISKYQVILARKCIAQDSSGLFSANVSRIVELMKEKLFNSMVSQQILFEYFKKMKTPPTI